MIESGGYHQEVANEGVSSLELHSKGKIIVDCVSRICSLGGKCVESGKLRAITNMIK